ncbi:MAG: ABC transporter ATP-binding protein [Acetatifactor sp.]|nr:ABC transporter ATP-binding protein [Acetatifactor sp.]
MLTIKGLKVKYGAQTALWIDSPIHINAGERVGIIGANGAGKSTLVKTILGLVDYEGSIISRIPPEEMAAHMQFNEYVDTMSVKCIMETILNTRIKNNRPLQDLIEYFDFQECLKKRYHALSGGQKQRFTIIMVMLQDSPLTFYDEVTSGLDFVTRQRLMEMLGNWYKDKDNTLMLVSHYYEELEQMADTLLLLDKGRVIAYGKKEELFKTFCGDCIYILQNTDLNRDLLKEYSRIKAPEHLLAISCRGKREEETLLSLLVSHNLDFKRSCCDIEIMSVNAIDDYYAKGKGEEINE